MPELPEVELSRRVWSAGEGEKVLAVVARNENSRVFRTIDPQVLQRELKGKKFFGSAARGKQLLFRFGEQGDRWLGVHLGMSGELRVEPVKFAPGKHDHLILRQRSRSLVFGDQRRFGKLQLAVGPEAPAWWSKLPPDLTSAEFTSERLAEFCRRRRRTALKPLLLMQEQFRGLGNLMADEILWRARLAPQTLAGTLRSAEIRRLHREIRFVVRQSVKLIDADWEYPKSWLFSHRWRDGGVCPRCGHGLTRAIVGGRRTCWCPVCQPLTA
jgi:formamidopyrimidine-DNA glycosylase